MRIFGISLVTIVLLVVAYYLGTRNALASLASAAGVGG